MARYRLSDPAKADIASVLRTSEARHGVEARVRYRGLLTAALRRIAADPAGLSTIDRGELFAGLRSLHIRHGRAESRKGVEPGLVEIVRLLHERMEPGRHVGLENEETTER